MEQNFSYGTLHQILDKHQVAYEGREKYVTIVQEFFNSFKKKDNIIYQSETLIVICENEKITLQTPTKNCVINFSIYEEDYSYFRSMFEAIDDAKVIDLSTCPTLHLFKSKSLEYTLVMHKFIIVINEDVIPKDTVAESNVNSKFSLRILSPSDFINATLHDTTVRSIEKLSIIWRCEDKIVAAYSYNVTGNMYKITTMSNDITNIVEHALIKEKNTSYEDMINKCFTVCYDNKDMLYAWLNYKREVTTTIKVY